MIENIAKKVIAEEKQISSKRMILDISLTSKLFFYYTVLGSFYRSRVFFMRINKYIRVVCQFNYMDLPVLYFFLAFTLTKLLDLIGVNRLM